MNKTIIIVIALILALLFGVGFVWPQYQSFRSLQTNIEAKNKELQSKEDYFSQLKETSERLKNYETELAKISSALPPDPSLPALFNFLQKTSSQSGLILEKISLGRITAPEENTGVGTTKEILVDFQLSGSYPALKDFLASLEKSARLIEVQNISFSSPKDLEKPFSFKLNIKTQSY